MIETVPPISDDTHNSEPSGLNSAKRGRESTSTLATIWRVAVSMKCAMLVVSEVLIRILPSGLMRHALGLDADLDVAEAGALFEIDDGHRVVVLVGDVEHLAGGILREQFGIGPGGQGVDDLLGLGVDHLDGVVVADRDHHELAVSGVLDAARPLADLDGLGHGPAVGVDDGDGVALLVRHIGDVGAARAPRQQARRQLRKAGNDATWAMSPSHCSLHLVSGRSTPSVSSSDT